MKTPRAAAFLALAASLASLCYLRADDGEESVAKAEKPKMAIFAEDVTVDGTRRPGETSTPRSCDSAQRWKGSSSRFSSWP
jgi:hypothetical protein